MKRSGCSTQQQQIILCIYEETKADTKKIARVHMSMQHDHTGAHLPAFNHVYKLNQTYIYAYVCMYM